MSYARRICAALCLLCLLTSSPPAGAQFPQELTAADQAIRKGKPERALRHLDRLGEPGDDFVGLAQWTRAVALAQTGEMDEAVCLWSRGVTRSGYLRGLDLEDYPSGDELAARLHLGGETLGEDEARRVEEPVPSAETLAAIGDLAADVTLDGVVTPDGRYLVRRVRFEEDDGTQAGRADLLVAETCRWRFAPAILDGESVALERRVTGAGLVDPDARIDLATVDVHPALRPVRDALAAGRWSDAVAASRATGDPHWSAELDFAGHALALEAFALRQTGDGQEALCTWLQAVHLEPALHRAHFGELAAFEPPDTDLDLRYGVRPDQAVTLPEILERPTPRRSVDLDGVPEEEMVAFASSVVDRHGRVRWAEVESSARPEVLLALVDTACRWVYRPGTLGGEPATFQIQTNLFLAPPAE